MSAPYPRLIALARDADPQVAAPLRAEAQRRGDPVGALLAALLSPDTARWPKLCGPLRACAAQDPSLVGVARRVIATHWGARPRTYHSALADLDAALSLGPDPALSLSTGLSLLCDPADPAAEDACWARVLRPDHLPNLSHLASLTIDSACSPRVARALLAASRALPSLTALSLLGPLDPDDADALLSALPAPLRHLSLIGCGLTDAALARALRPAPAPTPRDGTDSGPDSGPDNGPQAALEALDLTSNEAAALTAEALCAFPPALSLRALNLSFNHLDAPALAPLLRDPCPLPALTSLTLDSQHLGPEGAHALAASPLLRGLHHLSLHWCGLGDDGAHALAASPPTALTSLRLSANRVGAAGARALAAASAFPLLEGLDVSGNLIPPQALSALRASPHLRLRRLRYDR